MEKTIPEKFFKIAEKFYERNAFLYKNKKSQIYSPITYKELAEMVKIFISSLRKLQIKKGDKVVIFSENRPEWVIADLAAMSIGAIVVPLHTTLSLDTLSYIINHCEAKILIVSNNDLLNKIAAISEKITFLKKIIILEDLDNDSKDFKNKEILQWNKLFKLAETAEKKPFFLPQLNINETCSIIYTSGTTGLPKGVELTHQNFLSNFEAAVEAISVRPDDIFLSFLPLSHVFERLAGYYVSLFSGAVIAYAESIKKLPDNLKEIRPTILISVPRVFEKIYETIWGKINNSLVKKLFFFWALKQKDNGFKYKIANFLVFRKIRKQLGGRLRLIISGGAPMDKQIAKFFYKFKILILEGYGLTETSPVISVNREFDFKFGTVGKPIYNIEIKISPEKEILVRGLSVMKGYFKNNGLTHESKDTEGWFRTGDMGFFDKSGFLTIIGRKKEIIITSTGKNIWPEVIEQELNKDFFISQSVIIGQKRKFISALIVPNWNVVENFFQKQNLFFNFSENLVNNSEIINLFEKIIKEINKKFADYEKIKKFKLLKNEFSQRENELTPTLKLRRHIIEEHYKKEIKEIYYN